MATQIQWRKGTTAQHTSFTGVLAEVTVDTDKKTAVIHDGVTAGGFPLAKESQLTAANISNTPSGDIAATTVQAAINELDTEKSTKIGIQTQTYTAYTTGGTSTAYTLTPIPALTALIENQEFDVEFHTVAGTTPTLSISGLVAKSLKYRSSSGVLEAVTSTQIPTGWRSKVTYDGTDYIVREVPPSSSFAQIQSITCTQASGALTLGINATTLDFRSPTLATGIPNTRSVPTLSIQIPAAATLGALDGVSTKLLSIIIDNAGTPEQAVINPGGADYLSETGLISTTAISAAATNANVFYSTTARTNVPYRVVGFVDCIYSAGAWGNPDLVQGYGGRALAATSSLLATLTTTALNTSVEFTGLDTAAHKGYRIEINYKNGTATAHSLSMYVNGLTTATDYYQEAIYADGTAIGALRTNNADILAANASDLTYAVIDFTQVPGGYAMATSVCARAPGVPIIYMNYVWSKTVAVANVTSIQFTAGVADGIGIGTTFSIYRKDK